MRILFTGASSFTGFWFVRKLLEAGHDVTSAYRGNLEDYQGLRRERVGLLQSQGQHVFNCTFGSKEFLELVYKAGPWDILCHHAAEASNYKSPDFDVLSAIAKNSCQLPQVLTVLEAAGCRKVLLTGSIFEANEGTGGSYQRAFSPYGLSKGLTSEVFRYYCSVRAFRLAKFVIANPFGPYEEPRFTTYLARTWMKGQTARVKTPNYVRDNIHVSLLASAYVRFLEEVPVPPGFVRHTPSGYAESQGAFANRFASAMRLRLNLPCTIELSEQIDYSEPLIRIGTDSLDQSKIGWNEERAWDELADHYRLTLGRS